MTVAIQDTVADRYQILSILGSGGMGTTYRAMDLSNSQPVAIKVVSLRQAQEWKTLELFEREAKILADLDYPRIPDYLDYFEIDTPQDRAFYLVQELVEGKSLAQLVEARWQATESEAKEIAVSLLETLDYLHSRDIPIIHRDLKPENIIRREDGTIYLVDFGSVREAYRQTISAGGTFVGTMGYMSIEQLQGRATPVSDLYSLGCSLLYILTGKCPNEFPQSGIKLDFANEIDTSNEFKAWLAKILEPIAENRFTSAKEALTALESNSSTATQTQTNFRFPALPEDSKLIITQEDQRFSCKIPLGFYSKKQGRVFPAGTKTLLAVLLGIACLPEVTLLGLLGWLGYLSLYDDGKPETIEKTKNSQEIYVSLELDRQHFYLKRTAGIDSQGNTKIRQIKGEVAAIEWVNVLGYEDMSDRVAIFTKENNQEQEYIFGKGFLNKQEARYVAKKVGEFLAVVDA